MNEPKFRQYLKNEISVEEFLQSYPAHPEGINYNIASDTIELSEDFEITANHLIKLCNEVLEKRFSLNDISVIANWLMFSNYFHWECSTDVGKIISDAIFSWDNPDISYELTIDNVKLWKESLLMGENKLELKS